MFKNLNNKLSNHIKRNKLFIKINSKIKEFNKWLEKIHDGWKALISIPFYIGIYFILYTIIQCSFDINFFSIHNYFSQKILFLVLLVCLYIPLYLSIGKLMSKSKLIWKIPFVIASIFIIISVWRTNEPYLIGTKQRVNKITSKKVIIHFASCIDEEKVKCDSRISEVEKYNLIQATNILIDELEDKNEFGKFVKSKCLDPKNHFIIRDMEIIKLDTQTIIIHNIEAKDFFLKTFVKFSLQKEDPTVSDRIGIRYFDKKSILFSPEILEIFIRAQEFYRDDNIEFADICYDLILSKINSANPNIEFDLRNVLTYSYILSEKIFTINDIIKRSNNKFSSVAKKKYRNSALENLNSLVFKLELSNPNYYQIFIPFILKMYDDLIDWEILINVPEKANSLIYYNEQKNYFENMQKVGRACQNLVLPIKRPLREYFRGEIISWVTIDSLVQDKLGIKE
jgi:hypothetical protein